MPSSGFRMMSRCSAWKARMSASRRVTSVGGVYCGNSRRSRLVEHARAFALGLAQQVGGVEVLAVEGRVLAHHHGVSLAQFEGGMDAHGAEPALLTALALDLDGIRQRDLTRMGGDPAPSHPAQIARLAGQQAMAATLRLAHHGEGGVLVGLEGLQRVGNEKNLHGV
jgi:hypothetical protein